MSQFRSSQPDYTQPQEYQQPPSQPLPPQLNNWQQPPPIKPHKTRDNGIFWLILGIFIGLSIGFPVGHGTAYTYTASPTSQQTAVANDQTVSNSSQATGQPTSSSQPTTFSIGETATNSRWSVTLNSVKTATSGSYAQANAGDIFLVEDVTVENLTSSPQIISSGASFTLKDETGQAYSETITGIGVPPDTAALQPNDKLRGQISYEVPKDQHNFTFQFQGDFNGSAAIWAFSI